MLNSRRIAVVVQRYGEEVNGGAELHARWLAERLADRYEVHTLTTCAIEYHTWANAYPPGESRLNQVHIHRYSVDAPRKAGFLEQTVELLNNSHSLFDEIQWVRDQGPYSSGLLESIRTSYDKFDLFIFVTYLYAPAFFGLPLVSDKAILVPTAHDEPYLRFPIFRPLFHLPQAIVYNTEPEKQLVNAITQNYYVPQIVAGVGINVPPEVSADRFRQKYGIDGPFLIYVGRVDRAKNVHELLEFFSRFRDETGEDIKLILIGKVNMELPDREDIISLGFIPEADKFDAIRASTVLMMPSLYESLSMVTLEAWLMETPALLNGRCDVLKYQCRQSNAGLYYFTYDQFALTLRLLLDNPELRDQLGRQGKAFVAARYDWDIVMAKYQALIETLTGDGSGAL